MREEAAHWQRAEQEAEAVLAAQQTQLEAWEEQEAQAELRRQRLWDRVELAALAAVAALVALAGLLAMVVVVATPPAATPAHKVHPQP